MIDEEIEKALTDAFGLIISEDVCCSDVLDYINCLKDKLYQTEQNLGQCENGYKLELLTANMRIRSLEQDKEEIKQETIKKILSFVEHHTLLSKDVGELILYLKNYYHEHE